MGAGILLLEQAGAIVQLDFGLIIAHQQHGILNIEVVPAAQRRVQIERVDDTVPHQQQIGRGRTFAPGQARGAVHRVDLVKLTLRNDPYEAVVTDVVTDLFDIVI